MEARLARRKSVVGPARGRGERDLNLSRVPALGQEGGVPAASRSGISAEGPVAQAPSEGRSESGIVR